MTTPTRTPQPRPQPRPRRPRPHHPPSFYRKTRLRRTLRLLRTVVVAALLVWFAVWSVGRILAGRAGPAPPAPRTAGARTQLDSADGVKIGTFLGGPQRRFYGKGPVPEKLDLIWKAPIGSGWTQRKEDNKQVIWGGNGWTGQPSLVRDGGKLSLVLNGYDHNVHRYDAATGDTIWKYAFDDVIKSSVTVFANPHPTSKDDRLIVTAGSRRGSSYALGNPRIASYRAVSFGSGKELWRMPVPRTANYSQDIDASGLLLGGALFEAVEPGYMYKLDPARTTPWRGARQPVVLARSRQLWDPADVAAHGGEPGGSNLAIEASPAELGDRLIVNAGSGHVYQLSQKGLSVLWDFKTGSDIDGSPVVTRSNRLLIPVERQYVKHGGVYMLDPSKPPKDAVVWWFPTEDQGIAEWAGGVIGSVAVNDEYDADGSRPALAAFNSVDGYMYVVSQDQLAKRGATGPHGEKDLPTPVLVAKKNIASGISTPIMVDDHIVSTGYDKKVHVYRIDYRASQPTGATGAWLRSRQGRSWFTSVREVATFATGGPIEATPIVWKGRIYIGSRDGYFYCLGDKRQTTAEMDPATAQGD